MRTTILPVLVCVLVPALTVHSRSDERPAPAVRTQGRIFVTVQMAPGLALEGEKKDPYRGCAILAVDPDTGAYERIVEKAARPRLSGDGRTMVYLTAKGIAVRKGDGSSRFLKSVDPEKAYAVLSADGKEIIYGIERPPAKDGRRSFDSWRCAVAGGEPVKLPIPESDGVFDWSPDGQWLGILRWGRGGGAVQLHVMRPDGTGQRRLSDGSGVISLARFSPDGKRIVYMRQDGDKNSLWIMDADGHHPTKIVEGSAAWHPWACWSPDGKRLAVVDWKPNPNGPSTDYHLDVMDTDGRNRRRLPLLKAIWMSEADWR